MQDEDDYPEDDHVGVHEETMYLDIAPGCSEKGKEIVPVETNPTEAEDDSKVEFDDNSEDNSEEEAYEEISPHPILDFDQEDPPMEARSTYRNMLEFKLALCQHAIKHEFEFKTEKSSRRRFRAYCARKVEDNCPWRLHASTTVDKCTVMVRTIS